jgi:hypothetical protein
MADASEGPYVAVALSPTASGSMTIDAAKVSAVSGHVR